MYLDWVVNLKEESPPPRLLGITPSQLIAMANPSIDVEEESGITGEERRMGGYHRLSSGNHIQLPLQDFGTNPVICGEVRLL